MATQLLTPWLQEAAVELSGGTLRKQILPMRRILYTDKTGKQREIDFNKQYLTDLATAFKARAVDQVVLQLADGGNTHNNDPLRTAGTVEDVEVAEDGLYAIIRPNELGDQAFKLNPQIGVSARMFENVTRSDGKTFPRILQHVLATVDPQIPGMKPWEPVAAAATQLSVSGVDTVDLTNSSYQKGSAMPEANEGSVTLTLDAAQAGRLQLLLNDDNAAAAALAGAVAELSNQGGDDTSGGAASVPTLAQLQAQTATELSNAAQVQTAAEIELVRAQAEMANERVQQMAIQLANAQVEGELERLGSTGLAPAIIEAARPLLLLQPAAVELSNGAEQIDPGAVIRSVLDTVVALSRAGVDMIDLGRETGSMLATDTATSESQERTAYLAAWDEQYGK